MTLTPGGGPSVPGVSTVKGRQRAKPRVDPSCGTRALCGWSPPALPADSELKRWVDRLVPRTGVGSLAFFGAVIALLVLAAQLPQHWALVLDGLAALLAGGWCGLNFWRCRHAHCAVTAAGWLGLAALIAAEVAIGHSLVDGDEQRIFLGVFVAGLAFEGAWYLARGTNALTRAAGRS